MSIIPPLALVVMVLTWPNPHELVPTHWGFTGIPDLSSSIFMFWFALAGATLCALVAVIVALFLESDVARWPTAVSLAILLFVGSAAALSWPVSQLTASQPALENRIGPPFLLYIAALIWGGAALLIAASRPKRRALSADPAPR